jgi:hypothetical protein
MMAMLHLQDAQLLQHNFDALSRKLAERKASRWRKEPCVEAIEILEARQV